jgi:hypothetical protein
LDGFRLISHILEEPLPVSSKFGCRAHGSTKAPWLGGDEHIISGHEPEDWIISIKLVAGSRHGLRSEYFVFVTARVLEEAKLDLDISVMYSEEKNNEN